MTEPTKPNENEEQRSAPEQTPPMQPIVDMGAVTTRTARGTVYCLTVVGQIEGHSLLPNTVKTTKYEHVLPLLAALDESEEIDGVLLLLNTCGGDVEAGLAIAELIAGMRKPTVSLVLGGGHSIGVPLAVAPKRSLIAPSASMTVHPIRTNGTLIAAPQTYHYFDRLQERIVRFVTKNSGISEKKLLALMLAAEDMAASSTARRRWRTASSTASARSPTPTRSFTRSSPRPVRRRSRGGNARHRKNEAKRRPTGVFFTLCSSFTLEKRGGKWYST